MNMRNAIAAVAAAVAVTVIPACSHTVTGTPVAANNVFSDLEGSATTGAQPKTDSAPSDRKAVPAKYQPMIDALMEATNSVVTFWNSKSFDLDFVHVVAFEDADDAPCRAPVVGDKYKMMGLGQPAWTCYTINKVAINMPVEYEQGYAVGGVGAAQFTIAHEMGHFVDNKYVRVPERSRELFADCLAGVYGAASGTLDNMVDALAASPGNHGRGDTLRHGARTGIKGCVNDLPK